MSWTQDRKILIYQQIPNSRNAVIMADYFGNNVLKIDELYNLQVIGMVFNLNIFDTDFTHH